MQAIFSESQQAAIAQLCEELTQLLQCTVQAEYGQTDCGQLHDVALCVQSVPAGSWGTPGLLGTLVTSLNSQGTFAALDAQGAAITEGAPFTEAIQAIRLEASHEYKSMRTGAFNESDY